jgi:hypothetical protein
LKITNTSQKNHLATLRQKGTYSSTNLIRGSMLDEMFVLFSEYNKTPEIQKVADRVMIDNIIHKNSFYHRENVWRIFDQRYLSCPPWIVEKIAESTKQGIQSQEFVSLAYLYYSFRERLAYDFVTEFIWPRWKNKTTSVNSDDVYQFLIDRSKEIPVIDQWSETTLKRCSSSLLASLKDFGLLKGEKNKSIQRPAIALETAFQLLCILKAEGREGRSIIKAREWTLFLWSEVDTIETLHRLAQCKWIRFERSGPTTILEFIRLPGDE